MNKIALFISSLAKRIYALETTTNKTNDLTSYSFQILRKYPVFSNEEQVDFNLELHLYNGSEHNLGFSNVSDNTYQLTIQYFDENDEVIAVDENTFFSPESIINITVPESDADEVTYSSGETYYYRLHVVNAFHNQPTNAVRWWLHFKAMINEHGTVDLGDDRTLVSNQSLFRKPLG
jgi:hypothetical protein